MGYNEELERSLHALYKRKEQMRRQLEQMAEELDSWKQIAEDKDWVIREKNEDIKNLEDNTEAVRRLVRQLTVKVDDLEKRNYRAEESLKAWRNTNDNLISEIHRLESEVECYEGRIKELEQDNDELQMDLSEAADEIERLQERGKYGTLQSVTGGYGSPWLITWLNPEDNPLLYKSVVYYEDSPIAAMNKFLEYFRRAYNGGEYFIPESKLQELRIERAD